LEGVGLDTGPGVEYFEAMAALASIGSVVEIDETHRPLRLHTDSELALQFLRRAVKRERLPQRKTFDLMRPLYDLATDLAARRRIVPVKVASTRLEHGDCHRRAARKLREELATNASFAWRLAVRSEQHHLELLVKERTALQLRLEALEEEAVLIETRIRALNKAGLDEHSAPRTSAHFAAPAQESDQQ
jgi:hypothetical protein